jgi:hypothetical protein
MSLDFLVLDGLVKVARLGSKVNAEVPSEESVTKCKCAIRVEDQKFGPGMDWRKPQALPSRIHGETLIGGSQLFVEGSSSSSLPLSAIFYLCLFGEGATFGGLSINSHACGCT